MRGADPASETVQRAAMWQEWRHLTFLHWRYPVEIMRRLVPAPLEVDSFDGAAWLGITPFVLHGLRPPFAPSLPWISNFPETNCRTYVRGPDGGAGIWFFSLDAARWLAVAGARIAYGLPYYWSRMKVTIGRSQMMYESVRARPGDGARATITIEPGEPVEAGPLERFLTARFRLYSFLAGHLTYTAVEHEPWPLQGARVIQLSQTLTDGARLPRPDGPPLAHFSPGVCTRIAWPKSVGYEA